MAALRWVQVACCCWRLAPQMTTRWPGAGCRWGAGLCWPACLAAFEMCFWPMAACSMPIAGQLPVISRMLTPWLCLQQARSCCSLFTTPPS